MRPFTSLILGCFLLALAGCDQLGIETPDKAAARVEADGKAIGGACRHAGRALENCYEINRRASKAAVYAGWREMDGYMRENNIAVVKPTDPDSPAPAKEGEATKKTAEAVPAAVPAVPADEKAAEPAHAEKSAKVPVKTS